MARRVGERELDALVAVCREVAPDECWEYPKRARGTDGYAVVQRGGRAVMAHRASFEQFVGPIPEGMEIHHTCRTRACVNPAHLVPMSRRENVLLSNNAAAINARKTHCPKGHEYTTENTWVNLRRKGGTERRCKACQSARHRGWASRNRKRVSEIQMRYARNKKARQESTWQS